jgi:hypothetical protein
MPIPVPIDYRLTQTAQSYLEKEGLTKFFEGHGDAFVSSVTLGSEYYAVYVFHAQTRAEQTQLMVDIKANGVYSGASANASLETKVNKLRETTSTRSDCHQRLRGIVGQELPPPEKLITFAAAFPKLAQKRPAMPTNAVELLAETKGTQAGRARAGSVRRFAARAAPHVRSPSPAISNARSTPRSIGTRTRATSQYPSGEREQSIRMNCVMSFSAPATGMNPAFESLLHAARACPP